MQALQPSLQNQRGHTWLVFIPSAGVLGLVLLFPLLLSEFIAPQGIEVTPPSSRFQLADFRDAAELWLPAQGEQVILNGQLLSKEALPEQLAKLSKNSTEARLLIQADAQLSYQELAAVIELASQAGLRVALRGSQTQQSPPSSSLP